MSPRALFWLVVLLALGGIAWCFLPHGQAGHASAAGAPPCPLPPGVARDAIPLQTTVPGGMTPFVHGDARVLPQA
ncbi:MAG TPA: hypothetical protein VNS59_08495, partial [Lysobacter sp.]|nr:hypothetical protein [Lysobacter sp.]